MLDVSKSFLNKEASRAYSQLSEEDREQLNEGPEVQMSNAEVTSV